MALDDIINSQSVFLHHEVKKIMYGELVEPEMDKWEQDILVAERFHSLNDMTMTSGLVQFIFFCHWIIEYSHSIRQIPRPVWSGHIF